MVCHKSQIAFVGAMMRVNPNNYSDRREVPQYTIAEVAFYLSVNQATLRSWVLGRRYKTAAGIKQWNPLIAPALHDPQNPSLSFFNLVEAHILSAIRKEFGVSIRNIREALDEVQEKFPSKHPLITQNFHTDGVDLFIKKLEQWINVSQHGQLGLKEILDCYLKRIEWDASGLPVKIWPLKGSPEERVISIVPSIGSGRPIIDRKGIRAGAIWERHLAEEPDKQLADDYGLTEFEIKTAIHYFSGHKAA